MQTTDKGDDAASGRNAQRREIGRLSGRKTVNINAVGDNHKLAGRQATSPLRELGHRAADTDISIDPAGGETIEPQMPA